MKLKIIKYIVVICGFMLVIIKKLFFSKPPKEYWGTSSSKYGEVDEEGNVVHKPGYFDMK